MAKQVFRRRDRAGRFRGDHVTRADETADGEPLLVPVIRSGRLAQALPALDAIRARCREQLSALPERLLALDAQPDYPITYSDAAGSRRASIDRAIHRLTKLNFTLAARIATIRPRPRSRASAVATPRFGKHLQSGHG